MFGEILRISHIPGFIMSKDYQKKLDAQIDDLQKFDTGARFYTNRPTTPLLTRGGAQWNMGRTNDRRQHTDHGKGSDPRSSRDVDKNADTYSGSSDVNPPHQSTAVYVTVDP